MPEYRTPGVYVEETSYRSKTIEGVGSSVAGFVGPTLSGPVGVEPAPLTSFAEFAGIYGDLGSLRFGSNTRTNFTAHAVRAFFDNGGRRLYVSRIGDGAGAPPTVAAYKTGLRTFEGIEEISVVAAPGSTFEFGDDGALAEQVTRLLLTHCETMRYRIAVLDPPNGLIPAEVRDYRGKFDCTRAALYYPWVKTPESILPPSGFVAGIYARNDVQRGVHKAPANEVVRGATGFEILLGRAQQDMLNPEGVNCLRFFEGLGHRVWGARTISSDPEWKYVNTRRYFIYLERSIEKGTEWAVFENNGERLWANIRGAVESFLLNEWRAGALIGSKPEHAFFVHCDHTTMTQGDLDNGRLICLIGVATIKPTEFVIFRISHKTVDAS